MNDSAAFERYDTGILSLADLFRRDRLPCRAEPRRWLPAEGVDNAGGLLAPRAGWRARAGFDGMGPRNDVSGVLPAATGLVGGAD